MGATGSRTSDRCEASSQLQFRHYTYNREPFTNLLALVLLGASVITFASYLLQSPRDTGSLELAVAILAVVVINGAIGFFQA